MRISKSKRALVKSEAIYDVYKQPETVGKKGGSELFKWDYLKNKDQSES